MTAIEATIKKSLPDHWDQETADYHMEILFTFPENEWFAPSNKDGNHYDICQALYNANLIACKWVPLYANGQFKGNARYFIYRTDLNYLGI